ncbi:S-adenosyl-L-methionine-dependent methyltransferase [Fusarium venenatum]|uniref:S-adenosyl-L-methionine-dependent methyltransferase n=1 Tax=Fusarium venenatum TaxID=56646 RepID=UPI001DA1E0AC|nr:S-adenosyl-L-methionine-dependent methyltransferase [Fusarium venenatum]
MDRTDTVSPIAGETNLRNTPEVTSESVPSTMPSQGELELVAVQEESEEGDGDSALGDGVASSTASITSSILEYRKFQGRTFHSEKYDTEYFAPNDEQQRESIDISHHYLLLLLDGKLSLAHLNNDLEAILDIGTGTGNDFADQYPNAEVIGTDLSPIQPSWVPPNVKFDLEDATRDWSWSENSFDFVHMRYLIGAISDWGVLFKEAFRCCKPGGSIESVELFKEASKAFGRSFCEIEGDVQLLAAAGFVDLQVTDFKVPVGGWAKDPKLREVGQFLRATMEADLEGKRIIGSNLYAIVAAF